MNSKQLGRFLRKKRVASGLTQGELANKLGFASSQFVSNIERGVSLIPVPRIKDYSESIGLNSVELSKLMSQALSDKAVKKTTKKLDLEIAPKDTFVEAFAAAWQTASEKERECIKIVAEKVLGIEYTD